MSQRYLLQLRGFVWIEVVGDRIEELLTRSAERRLKLWDIRRTGQNKIEMYILLKHFFELRPLLKETGCRIHVKKRSGLPFFLDRLERRKLFAAGFVVFIVGIFVLTSLVWQVRVTGNELTGEEQILQAASQGGVHPFQWKFKLKDPSVLAKQIMSQVPGLSWVGVEVRGTHVLIRVVEAQQPKPKPLLNPRHLVASHSAVVSHIYAEKGKPLVHVQSRVKKGDILISGILGDEANQQIVVAEGQVRGLVWHEMNITVPLTQKYRIYTGADKERRYITLGNRAIQLTGYGKSGFQKTQTLLRKHPLRINGFELPVGWMEEKRMEVLYKEKTISIQEAERQGIEQAKKKLVQQSGENAVVVGQNILHQKTDSGKVYMKVLFEVDELISVEQPIVPLPINQGE